MAVEFFVNNKEVELKEEMNRLIDLAATFYEREITRFAEE